MRRSGCTLSETVNHLTLFGCSEELFIGPTGISSNLYMQASYNPAERTLVVAQIERCHHSTCGDQRIPFHGRIVTESTREVFAQLKNLWSVSFQGTGSATFDMDTASTEKCFGLTVLDRNIVKLVGSSRYNGPDVYIQCGGEITSNPNEEYKISSAIIYTYGRGMLSNIRLYKGQLSALGRSKISITGDREHFSIMRKEEGCRIEITEDLEMWIESGQPETIEHNSRAVPLSQRIEQLVGNESSNTGGRPAPGHRYRSIGVNPVNLSGTNTIAGPRAFPVGNSLTRTKRRNRPDHDPNEDNETDIPDIKQCKVCFAREMKTVINPCNHVALCVTCARNETIERCPICKTDIDNIQRVYFS